MAEEAMCPCGCGETYEVAVRGIMAYGVDRFTAEVLLLKASEEVLENKRRLAEDDD